MLLNIQQAASAPGLAGGVCKEHWRGGAALHGSLKDRKEELQLLLGLQFWGADQLGLK